jgi:kynurenine aminotransferase
MWERTITVGSSGKTFGVTGWRVGWLIGPEALIKVTTCALARTVFCVSTPIQVRATIYKVVLVYWSLVVGRNRSKF